MRLIVKDFGPIKEADITLNDMNILIGKNASGKSYLAYLMWSLLSVEPDFEIMVNLINKNFNTIEDIHDQRIAKSTKGALMDIFRNVNQVFFKALEDLLRDVFLVDNIVELTRRGASITEIILCNNEGNIKLVFRISEELGFSCKGIEPNIIKKIQKDLKITQQKIGNGLNLKVFLGDEEVCESYCGSLTDLGGIISGFVPVIFVNLFDGFIPHYEPFVGPDGRAGLTRVRESLLHVLLATRRPVYVNPVDSYFMKYMETLGPKTEERKTPDLGDFIEKKLGAEFIVQRAPPRYLIKMKNMELPLQRGPSGFREVSSIILTLKYGKTEGDIMIIEEPEAHLHPDAKIIITRALAGASKLGWVVITTHSISILDEISNLIRLNKLDKKDKEDLGYEEWEGLDPNSISIYCIHDGEVEPLEVDEEGLSESGLDRIIEEIANQHAEVANRFKRRKKEDV